MEAKRKRMVKALKTPTFSSAAAAEEEEARKLKKKERQRRREKARRRRHKKLMEGTHKNRAGERTRPFNVLDSSGKDHVCTSACPGTHAMPDEDNWLVNDDYEDGEWSPSGDSDSSTTNTSGDDSNRSPDGSANKR